MAPTPFRRPLLLFDCFVLVARFFLFFFPPPPFISPTILTRRACTSLNARRRASGGSFRNRRYPSTCSDPAAAYNRVRAGVGGGGAFRFGSVFVTFSRRTPKSLRAALHRHLALRMVAAHTNALSNCSMTGTNAKAEAAAAAAAAPGRRGVPPGGRHRHLHGPDGDDDFYEQAGERERPVVAAASASRDATAPLVAATTDDSDGLASMLFGPKIHTAWARERSGSPIVLPKSPGLWVWDDQGPNPYEGAMAW